MLLGASGVEDGGTSSLVPRVRHVFSESLSLSESSSEWSFACIWSQSIALVSCCKSDGVLSVMYVSVA